MKTKILDKEINSMEDLERFIDESKTFAVLVIDPYKFKNASDFEDDIRELASRRKIIIAY
jgi:hypothetical protein